MKYWWPFGYSRARRQNTIAHVSKGAMSRAVCTCPPPPPPPPPPHPSIIYTKLRTKKMYGRGNINISLPIHCFSHFLPNGRRWLDPLVMGLLVRDDVIRLYWIESCFETKIFGNDSRHIFSVFQPLIRNSENGFENLCYLENVGWVIINLSLQYFTSSIKLPFPFSLRKLGFSFLEDRSL